MHLSNHTAGHSENGFSFDSRATHVMSTGPEQVPVAVHLGRNNELTHWWRHGSSWSVWLAAAGCDGGGVHGLPWSAALPTETAVGR